LKECACDNFNLRKKKRERESGGIYSHISSQFFRLINKKEEEKEEARANLAFQSETVLIYQGGNEFFLFAAQSSRHVVR